MILRSNNTCPALPCPAVKRAMTAQHRITTQTRRSNCVQLAHNGGVAGTDPVQFNQDGNTTTYTRTPAMGQNDPLTGITHTIPMRASVYRTSTAPVVGGNLNAAVWVYIQYP